MFLTAVVRGLRTLLVVSDVISVDVLTDSVRLIRLGPVRPDAERRAVFRSTTREAVEAFGSISILFLPVERSLFAIRLVRPLWVFSPTSITFIRDVPASVLVVVSGVVLAVSRVDARP